MLKDRRLWRQLVVAKCIGAPRPVFEIKGRTQSERDLYDRTFRDCWHSCMRTANVVTLPNAEPVSL